MNDLIARLQAALAARKAWLGGEKHEEAFRLFNGFYEGDANLVVDVYARTLLIYNHADDPAQNRSDVMEAARWLQTMFDWIEAIILKTRGSPAPQERRGELIFGARADTKIKEHGVWYAVNLTINRDASFYLDTRNLRKWLIDSMRGKTVLNTFAYTGSLGVAALAGGANRVIQIDRSAKFLNLAKQSCALNGFPVQKGDLIARDFFEQIANLKRQNTLFDCVILDPPFFSTTPKGSVNQVHESARLINKVRPLVKDGGVLVAVNNALYLSGREYINVLETLCKDGYLQIRELIPAPEDIAVRSAVPPITDPAPFNHSTKIAVLDVRRK